MTHKIVITGIGASSPLGGTARDSWQALLAGESGASTLEHGWVEQYDLPVTFAAQAKVRPDTVLERPVAPAPGPRAPGGDAARPLAPVRARRGQGGVRRRGLP